MASQTTAAAGRGHKLFTIPSKASIWIKQFSPWVLKYSISAVTLVLYAYNSPFRKRKTMRLARALSDLVKYTKSVRVHDIETQGKGSSEWTSNLKSLYILEHNFALIILHSEWMFPCLVAFTNSWQVSSLNETVMNQILQLKPGQLVRFNQRQLLRVYPSNFRVDSSNFNPQPYWNAGCHMGKSAMGTAILPTFRKLQCLVL